MSGQFFDPEIFSPGLALFDFDNDDDLDVYVVQGRMLGPRETLGDALIGPGATPQPLTDRLFRNDLAIAEDGTRTLRFTDVTAEAGLTGGDYGVGVAAGDIDNDGWTDLYVMRLGSNALLRNNGDGTFTDTGAASGVADAGSWSVSASLFDYDRDGWLDLYVANYLSYRVDQNGTCFSPAGARDYCDPSNYRPGQDRLFRNLGDGRFTDVTMRALAGRPGGAALGVVAADFNGDGWSDFYVANDRRDNDLWINQRDGTFRNDALRAGAAVNIDGRAEASMGVDAGDYNNDGREDLFMTNFTSEGHTLYVNRADGTFEDAGIASGLRVASRLYTGFGTAWFDYDNDGWLDLLTVNGAVQTIEAQARAGDPLPLRQPKQLFRNLQNGRFEDVTRRAGPVFAGSSVGRGAAFGDVDNDGDIDVAVANTAGPVELLLNGAAGTNHWIGLRLRDRRGRDALGARVVVSQGSRTRWRRVRADGSYASANDPRVLVGLGDDASSTTVEVIWPDGNRERWPSLPVDRWATLVQGTGD
jgi:hypothetical protein